METFIFKHNNIECVIIDSIPCPICGRRGKVITDNLHGIQPDVCSFCNQAAMYDYDAGTAEPISKIKGLSNFIRDNKLEYNNAKKVR